MMSARWKKFEGTQDQLDEMKNAPHGWIVRRNDGAESDIFRESPIHSGIVNSEISEYLICDPLPHAEMIARHAMTGQPVYLHTPDDGFCRVWCYPTWQEDRRYSFNPSRGKEFIEVREYVWRDKNGDLCIGLIENSICFRKPTDIENNFNFVKWVDQDWRRIEI